MENNSDDDNGDCSTYRSTNDIDETVHSDQPLVQERLLGLVETFHERNLDLSLLEVLDVQSGWAGVLLSSKFEENRQGASFEPGELVLTRRDDLARV